MRTKLLRLYELMVQSLGPQHWWPGDTALEVCVGAVLTQNTSWKNVEKAITHLKEAGYLLRSSSRSPRPGMRTAGDSPYLARLNSLSESRLAQLIRPAGYFNVKARRLKNFLEWVFFNFGSLDGMFATPIKRLRLSLLGVNGIGPETADSILLYAGGKRMFVIDAYTRRILNRHRLASDDNDYQGLQELFMKALPRKSSLYNEYHALMVKVGKDYCHTRRPRCEICPLNGFNWSRGRPGFLVEE